MKYDVDVNDPYSAAMAATNGLTCHADDRPDLVQEAAHEVVKATAYFRANNNGNSGTGLAGYQTVAARRAAYRWLMWRRKSLGAEVPINDYCTRDQTGAFDAAEHGCFVARVVSEVAEAVGGRYAVMTKLLLDRADEMYALAHDGRNTTNAVAAVLGVRPAVVRRMMGTLEKYLASRASVYIAR